MFNTTEEVSLVVTDYFISGCYTPNVSSFIEDHNALQVKLEAKELSEGDNNSMDFRRNEVVRCNAIFINLKNYVIMDAEDDTT